ncbi:hypothetical protein KPL71_025812 [Citrus sinensis]|uniref:Uncharacterized protein n=1 Tax=Citrus sinensis TaxID=2711 RepID=A0ACB8HV73_CITSI|nr:hypothetical protein KPL71_025812 [Citrus sinensis]
MAMAKSVVVSLTIMALFGAAMAATYTVGDDAGWTIQGHIDYSKWAEGKQFHVGDTLVFKYNKAMHDVRQVSHEDFQSCNAKAPIEEYTTGMDSITLKMAGHHYFLCGIPGHCQVGQKVEINVLPGASSPGESPAPSPSHNGSPAPSPSHTESPAPSPGHSGSSTPPSSSGGSSSSTPAEPGEGLSSSTPPPSSSAPSLWSSNFWFAAPGMLAVFLTAFAF